MKLRLATVEDAQGIQGIYAPYVNETAVTFELVAPTVADMAGRIESTGPKYPYIVAEEEGRILGYAYAHAFRPRAAYAHSVETSIYVDRNVRAKGVGGRLYRCLEKLVALQNVYIMDACIAYSDPPDEYVPDTSVKFHEHLGYRKVAQFDNCGRKFDRWYGMVWMEKVLVDAFPAFPEEFRPFGEVDSDAVAAIFAEA